MSPRPRQGSGVGCPRSDSRRSAGRGWERRHRQGRDYRVVVSCDVLCCEVLRLPRRLVALQTRCVELTFTDIILSRDWPNKSPMAFAPPFDSTLAADSASDCLVVCVCMCVLTVNLSRQGRYHVLLCYNVVASQVSLPGCLRVCMSLDNST